MERMLVAIFNGESQAYEAADALQDLNETGGPFKFAFDRGCFTPSTKIPSASASRRGSRPTH
jgi:hypothetical protein